MGRTEEELTIFNPSSHLLRARRTDRTSRRFLQESYRIILVLNYLAICYVLQKIPLLGRPLAFVFMSFIDGYYIFETIWVARGWSLERRMRYAECRWSYFVAFGLPSTLISFFHPSGLLNVMLFMLSEFFTS
ncbi:unnamed protein product [Tilletia caries]|uniref:Ion transport domain-containing protein n=1 Tax=Tilletia caries TaxID=13290 RepID=A0ABN7IPN2_9BASI|nr:unnamed protein product [Tilletia caries]